MKSRTVKKIKKGLLSFVSLSVKLSLSAALFCMILQALLVLYFYSGSRSVTELKVLSRNTISKMANPGAIVDIGEVRVSFTGFFQVKTELDNVIVMDNKYKITMPKTALFFNLFNITSLTEGGVVKLVVDGASVKIAEHLFTDQDSQVSSELVDKHKIRQKGEKIEQSLDQYFILLRGSELILRDAQFLLPKAVANGSSYRK